MGWSNQPMFPISTSSRFSRYSCLGGGKAFPLLILQHSRCWQRKGLKAEWIEKPVKIEPLKVRVHLEEENRAGSVNHESHTASPAAR